MANGHSIQSAYVNEDSNSDDKTFPTKATDGRQQFQHEEFSIDEEEQLSRANDAFVINYKEHTEDSNFVLKPAINQQRQLAHCTSFQDFISCDIARCKWTRKVGCRDTPQPIQGPNTSVLTPEPTISSIPSVKPSPEPSF
eukprot:5005459-Ditylum_brightwellii.AAC.1